MSGFSFRLTTLLAKFGCGSRHQPAYALDLTKGIGGSSNRSAPPLPPCWDSPCKFNGLWPRFALHVEKGPVFRGVSLRIGRKGPSCRDGSATWRFGRDVADEPTVAARNGQERPIGAVVRLPRAKAAVSAARTLPNLGGISDTCLSPSRFFPVIPIFSS